MTDSKREVWVVRYQSGNVRMASEHEEEARGTAEDDESVERYVPAPSVPEAPETAKAHRSAAALLHEHAADIQEFAGERSAELCAYLLELFEREMPDVPKSSDS